MQFSRRSLPPLSSLLPFEAAARLQSITEAAQELGLTQAAISKQIKSIETFLGVSLFERRNRAVHLTPDGQRLQQVIHAALGDIASTCTALQATRGDGEIVLRAQACEAVYWLMPRLSGFYQTHPGIDLRVSVSTRPLAQAHEPYHMALQSIGREAGRATLVHTARDEVFPVCNPAYTDAGALSKPTDLHGQRLLHHHSTPQDWMTWDSWLAAHGQPPRDIATDQVFDSYQMVMQAAIEGHGIALGWQRTCEHLLRTGALVRPCPASLHLQDGLGLYVPDADAITPKTQALLTWLKAELA